MFGAPAGGPMSLAHAQPPRRRGPIPSETLRLAGPASQLEAAWLDELSELLRIPSVSADPAHADDVRRAGEWVCEFVRARGRRGGARADDGARSRSRSARSRACERRARRRPFSSTATSTCSRRRRSSCGTRRRSSPRSATAISTRAAPRTTRATLYLLLKAAALAGARSRRCPSTCASPSTGRRRPAATRSSISSPRTSAAPTRASSSTARMPREDVPAFDMGTRGLVVLPRTVRTGERDLHSGIYGGAALNAVHALMQVARRRSSAVPDELRARDRSARRTRSCAAGRRSTRARAVLAEAGRDADGRPRRRGVLPAHVRATGGRRQRHQGRRGRPAEDGAPGRGRSERLHPARAGPGRGGDRDRVRAAAAGRRAAGRRARGPAAASSPRRGSIPPTRRRCSSRWTRSSVRSGGGRSFSATGEPCRSCRRSRTGASRRS